MCKGEYSKLVRVKLGKQVAEVRKKKRKTNVLKLDLGKKNEINSSKNCLLAS